MVRLRLIPNLLPLLLHFFSKSATYYSICESDDMFTYMNHKGAT